MDLSRREFMVLAASFAVLPRWPSQRAAPHIALIHSPDFHTAAQAAAMSAREVQRSAQLLRREFHFSSISAAEFTSANNAWSALIRATHAPFALPAGIPVIDIVDTTGCLPNTYYLRPVRALAVWHGSLERFGAGQLNARFRFAGIDPINDQAWLGWFAVKCLWESAARGKQLEDLSFDGHKGQALVFNRARRLVQPLYELSPDRSKVVAEIPPSESEREASCAS